MDAKLGVITEIVDFNYFSIKFTIEGWIENAMAYPINQKDEPNVGDPIIIFVLQDKFGYSFLYQKLKLKDFIRYKLGNSEIDITENNVQIRTKEGNEVIINSDGTININSNTEVNISCKGDINLNSEDGGDINLKANSGNVILDASMIELSGKYVGDPSTVGEAGFSVSPTGPMGLCPLTRTPHTCSRIIKAG